MNEEDKLIILKTWITISTYRERVLKAIGDELKIPKEISAESGIRINHISSVLSQLKERELVICVNEEARKGRLYKLTDLGLKMLSELD